MRILKPVREGTPSLPVPKKKRPQAKNFGRKELFGFDTETTRCGKKEFRSCQFAFYDTFFLRVEVYSLKGWFSESKERCEMRLNKMVEDEVRLKYIQFETIDELRYATQKRYEELVFDGQPRVKRNRAGKMKLTSRKAKRCAVAFNGNFDLGVIADYTDLQEEMFMGGMTGNGCTYDFRMSYEKFQDEEYGMRIKALFLGAKSIPYVQKRGVIWDIQSLTSELWNCVNLASVGKKIGIRKLVGEGETSLTYAAVDAIITVEAAWQLTCDLENMGFTGNPDRFISGATVSKDMMSQFYTPFHLTQDQHDFVWPAYYGGMTGALSMDIIRRPLENVVYGDLDGAYNASGQLLEVFKWESVKWLSGLEVQIIVKHLEKNPADYWKYGSLHLEVEGDFDNVPLRVGVCSEKTIPSKSEGLVWASITNYKTTMSIGDYLHSRPSKVVIHRGLMATDERSSQPCLFKMTDSERKKFPKYESDGVTPIWENWISNTWYKLAGNCLYGSFANRNGKERMDSGKWFNGIIASSITGAIRHCMWVVNEVSDAHYNDTDSALTSREGFHKAVEALKPLKIGFSNKTNDELEGHSLAAFGVVQGSKRYALVAEDGTFGAKCHGLGSWFMLKDGRVQSIAHNEELLENVWRFVYPHIFGKPDPEVMKTSVFHKFSIKTRKISLMVQEYARRQWDIPLKDIHQFGKSGNFGFLSPTLPDPEKKTPHVVVSFEPEVAESLSDFTLQDIAYVWGCSYDKKFDYENLKRWSFDGSQIRYVKSFERMVQTTPEKNDILATQDISLKNR